MEFVRHPVLPSGIVWTTKFVSMKNVSQGATKIANVLNFMNAEEVFVLWLKNVVQTMTVLHLNLVPQPFLSKYQILNFRPKIAVLYALTLPALE